MIKVNSKMHYPALFLNSVPKSGTHLMKQIIQGIPEMALNPNEFYEGYREDYDVHYGKLQKVQPGEFVTGHVYYSSQWSDMLKELKFKHIFLKRDLRDIVVSYTYFITGKYPYHPLRTYMLALPSRREQFLALIQGVPEHSYPSIADWYVPFAGWDEDDSSLQITFEELVVSPASRRQTMERVLNFLWSNRPLFLGSNVILDGMERNINPENAYTFRTGKSGNWRSEFDEEVKSCFKQVAGDLLIEAGYEADYDW